MNMFPTFISASEDL